MTNRIARKSEQQRWNELQQHLAQRYVKHAKNLPEGCHGCMVGMKWTTAETIRLIETMDLNRLMIADLCNVMNRTANGITGRLTRLGILRWDGVRLVPCEVIAKRRIVAMDPLIVESLLLKGWERNTIGQLVSPREWYKVRIIYTGLQGLEDKHV